MLGLRFPAHDTLEAVPEECRAFQEAVEVIKLFLVCAFPGKGRVVAKIQAMRLWRMHGFFFGIYQYPIINPQIR
jgi:hypothetical protein